MTTWKEYSEKKIISPSEIENQAALLKKEGKTIVTLNGSFDILHAGHMYILFEAAKRADVLIVAVNSDASIRGYKAKGKPIIPLAYRMEMLSALAFVHYVTWFDELDPREILKKIKPQIHVNGAEYGENCIESEVVKENGGKLHLVSRIDGLATSEIISRIQKLKEM